MCCIYQCLLHQFYISPGVEPSCSGLLGGLLPQSWHKTLGAAASGAGQPGAETGPAWDSATLPTRVPREPNRTGPDPLRVIYCARPRSPPHPAPSVCPQACPALASSLRGARLVYLLQHPVIYKIFNKTRIFLTVTAAFLFTWKLPSPLPPSFGRGGGSGGGKGPIPAGGVQRAPRPGPPRPLPLRQRNETHRPEKFFV